jgi:hypothetical protein
MLVNLIKEASSCKNLYNTEFDALCFDTPINSGQTNTGQESQDTTNLDSTKPGNDKPKGYDQPFKRPTLDTENPGKNKH